jgi:hypothetical protein
MSDVFGFRKSPRASLATARPQGMLLVSDMARPSGENAAHRINHFRRSFREVSEYSTVGPELARQAACSRQWHHLKTGRDQIPH